jgi:hypothetical protein
MALLTSSGTNATPTKVTNVGPGPAAAPLTNTILSKTDALLNNPAPAYTGQLTAGTSELQGQAFEGLSNLTLPETMTTAGDNLLEIGNKAQGITYTPVGSAFDAKQAQQYMNPYLQAALNPQLEEARRQSQITQLGNAAKATSQGAFGGSRSALMDAETQRNLGTNLANITGTGYRDAYDKAANQFNEDQKRQIQEAQYGTDTGLKSLSTATTANQAAGNVGSQEAQYGLENLKALSVAGNTQQAQEQAALNAQYNQYLDQRNQPWKNLADANALAKGAGGTSTQEYSAEASELQKAVGITGAGAELMKNLKAAGMSPDSITKALKAIGYDPETLTRGTDAGLKYDTDYATSGGNVDPSTLIYDANGPTGYKDVNGRVVNADGTPYEE